MENHKVKFNPYYTPCTKMNQVGHRPICTASNYKLLGKKQKYNLVSKVTYLIKIQDIISLKDTVKRMKRQYTDKRNYCQITY